jgi:hypothetical protein
MNVSLAVIEMFPLGQSNQGQDFVQRDKNNLVRQSLISNRLWMNNYGNN